jgi:dihydrofolate reductase
MKAIIACDAHGGIGKNNQLPWASLDNDLQRFKALTQNATVVMGHKTWASLPKKPLPNRRNIVVSRSITSIVGADVVSNISNITHLPNAWFIGGAELLNHIWAHIDEFHLTRANALFDCDTYIDLVHLEQNFIQTQYQLFKDNTYEVWVRK